MFWLKYIVLLGAAVAIFGSLAYARDTIRGTTRPNKITWFLWSAAPIIGSIIAFENGAGWVSLPVFMAGFGPFIIFISSFFNKKSYWKLHKTDYLCGILSLFALVVWLTTKQPVISIVFAIASDFLAAVPTLIKSWKFPDSESGWTYLTGLFNASTSFFAIKSWVFADVGYPIYIIIICSSLTFAIYRSQIKKFAFNICKHQS